MDPEDKVGMQRNEGCRGRHLFRIHSPSASGYSPSMHSPAKKHGSRRRIRKIVFRILGLGLLFSFVMIIVSSCAISRAAKGRVYDSVKDIPKRKVGLVLGSSKHLADGSGNLFYAYRVAAAAELFRSGKVDYLLVSGDNHVATYDESSDMKNSIATLGVPTNAIYCDYAGFRTFDSVVRAKKVFGEDKFTVVSQRFHNERAIFIARAMGIDAIGYNAQEVDAFNGFRTKLREKLAKVKAVLDVYVLRTKPRFLGEQIAIGE
jgi:SanA protein